MTDFKCIVCNNSATYVINNTGAEVQSFCEVHLPGFYNKKALPHFIETVAEKTTPAPVVEAVAEKPVKKAAPKVKETTPEPVVEAVAEPVVEEPVVE